jgi:hypothetical protein
MLVLLAFDRHLHTLLVLLSTCDWHPGDFLLQLHRRVPDFLRCGGMRRFLSKHFGASGQRLNRLLIKDPLGAPKHTSFKLPPEAFSYGRASVPDNYDAKATITGWYAPDQRKTRTGAGSKPRSKAGVPASVVFGRPSPVVTVKTSDILSNRYGGLPGRQEPEYPAHSSLAKPRVAAGTDVRTTRAFTMASAKTRALAAAAKSEEEGGRSAAAGTMLATAIAAAATAAGKGGTGAAVRLNGEGDWKIKKFDKVRAVTHSWATEKPPAYKEMLRRTGKAPAAKAPAAKAPAATEEVEVEAAAAAAAADE